MQTEDVTTLQPTRSVAKLLHRCFYTTCKFKPHFLLKNNFLFQLNSVPLLFQISMNAQEATHAVRGRLEVAVILLDHMIANVI